MHNIIKSLKNISKNIIVTYRSFSIELRPNFEYHGNFKSELTSIALSEIAWEIIILS